MRDRICSLTRAWFHQRKHKAKCCVFVTESPRCLSNNTSGDDIQEWSAARWSTKVPHPISKLAHDVHFTHRFLTTLRCGRFDNRAKRRSKARFMRVVDCSAMYQEGLFLFYHLKKNSLCILFGKTAGESQVLHHLCIAFWYVWRTFWNIWRLWTDLVLFDKTTPFQYVERIQRRKPANRDREKVGKCHDVKDTFNEKGKQTSRKTVVKQ